MSIIWEQLKAMKRTEIALANMEPPFEPPTLDERIADGEEERANKLAEFDNHDCKYPRNCPHYDKLEI